MNIDRYLRVKQICEITGLSRATIYALEKAGKFPGKVALGARAVAWRESTIAKWMEERESVVKPGRKTTTGASQKEKGSGEAEKHPSTRDSNRKKGIGRAANIAEHQKRSDSSASQNDDWTDSNQSISDEEIAAIRAKLARNNKLPSRATKRSGAAPSVNAPAQSPGKGVRGTVTVLAGPAQRKKTR